MKLMFSESSEVVVVASIVPVAHNSNKRGRLVHLSNTATRSEHTDIDMVILTDSMCFQLIEMIVVHFILGSVGMWT
jgi:hypothetical protein